MIIARFPLFIGLLKGIDMFGRSTSPMNPQLLFAALAVLALVLIGVSPDTAHAQVIQQAVGGVSVSVDGVLSNVDAQHGAELREARMKVMQAVPGEMGQAVPLRMVSLKKLDEKIAQCIAANQPLPDEVKYLAGLQRVQYVFADPETKDVILAGPAEGWQINPTGNVVGVTTGRPVLHLDDLLVALRFADAARNGGMSVSMDPTAAGLQRWGQVRSQYKTIGSDPQATISALEKAMGAQNISINGVPSTSRFANVLVAADYRMKRLAMGFDPLPVARMQNYMQLIGAAAASMMNVMPRWWLAPRYEPLLTDADGMSWELRGPGVMAMAEEDLVNAAGQRTKSSQAVSPTVRKWADSLTAHYEEISKKDPAFAELRNCMDLAVVGALLMKEQLLEKADLHPTCLYNDQKLGLDRYNPPKQVDSKASYVKKGKDWIICVSGGVQLQPWAIIQKHDTSADIAPVRSAAMKAHGDSWWWNGGNN